MKNILSVLVIENNPVLASRLTSYLTGLGWNVDFAASGRLALRLVNRYHYDAVLLDTQLPDMAYPDVLKGINPGLNSKVPVLTMGGGEQVNPSGNCYRVSDPANMKEVASQCMAVASNHHFAISA